MSPVKYFNRVVCKKGTFINYVPFYDGDLVEIFSKEKPNHVCMLLHLKYQGMADKYGRFPVLHNFAKHHRFVDRIGNVFNYDYKDFGIMNIGCCYIILRDKSVDEFDPDYSIFKITGYKDETI